MIGNEESSKFISLYLHIPFCSKKCPYCHFYVQKSNSSDQRKFLSALKKEILQNLDQLRSKTIYSIYIGGGTPSQLDVFEIQDLLDEILKLPVSFHPSCEITLEANPEDLQYEYLKALSQTSINRLSIGVQSLDDELLNILSRQHDAKQAMQAVENAFHLGIENISIDLMYELPHQTLSSFETTLQNVTKLPISHLSLYNLTFEPKTAFYRKKKLLMPHVPKDETSKHMLDLAVHHLEKNGLHRYEISAFCKNGYFSKHNVGYWLGRDFLGFGPSAFSFMQGKRYQNICHLKHYIEKINNNESAVHFEEKLEKQAHIKELIAINLRLFEGCNLEKYNSHKFLQEIIEKLEEEKLATYTSPILKLTAKGIDFYDDVGMHFV